MHKKVNKHINKQIPALCSLSPSENIFTDRASTCLSFSLALLCQGRDESHSAAVCVVGAGDVFLPQVILLWALVNWATSTSSARKWHPEPYTQYHLHNQPELHLLEEMECRKIPRQSLCLCMVVWHQCVWGEMSSLLAERDVCCRREQVITESNSKLNVMRSALLSLVIENKILQGRGLVVRRPSEV